MLQPSGPRMTLQTLRVLKVFLDAFNESVRMELAGADIMRQGDIASGTMYPILLRLEDAGWLTSRWEAQKAEDLGRPRRRFYKLTPSGLKGARAAFSALAPHGSALAQGA